ncbi:DUF3011 domain-containing protein [Ottowia testudinis]|uniref:DUF3011 domain-containing protein n=1 Tax=Ottowia testudinis TaxID=2816950 RepID=A0A975H7K2_9BURK|nr:DUF3011 domain-containing protein [Ottowia testudinis]QTD47147.1 DUF3011 domain-containing protein [Ottowia testudinis]
MTRSRFALGLATVAAALALAGCETYGPVYGSPGGPGYGYPVGSPVGGAVNNWPGYGGPVYGQPDYSQPAHGGVFRCESEQGAYRECGVPGGGQASLVRQLSESACVPGRTWGQRGAAVWVNAGCRAEFAVQGGYGYGGGPVGGYAGGAVVTCSSEEGRTATCGWDPRMGRPMLIEQLSSAPCHEGMSWGQSGRGEIWVSRGCRGRFGVR